MGGDFLGVFKHLRKQDKKIPLRKQAEIEVLRSLQENPAEFLKTLSEFINSTYNQINNEKRI